jgi:nuclear pore complex protein Nup205
MIESLLLLVGRCCSCQNMTTLTATKIWRHLLFYANDARGSSAPIKPDNLSVSLGAFASSQLDGSRSGAGSMRTLEKVATSLREVLDRMDEVDIVSR